MASEFAGFWSISLLEKAPMVHNNLTVNKVKHLAADISLRKWWRPKTELQAKKGLLFLFEVLSYNNMYLWI